MIVLKWLLIVVAIGYLGGVAVLYFKQRSIAVSDPADRARRLRKQPVFRKLKSTF